MVEIGKTNTLRVIKEVDFGLYLDGDDFGEILMPKRYAVEGTEVDHFVDVFVYVDSEDRLIATTEEPLAKVGDFVNLKVVQTTSVGAFLDWGLMKDLLVPFSEQRVEMVEEVYYFVHVYVDQETNRIVASTKVNKFLDNVPAEYEEGQEVDLIIGTKSDLGMNVVINRTHTGLLYQNEIFQTVKPGQKIKGFIKKLREDEKIDVTLQRSGYEWITGITGEILTKLQSSGGFIRANDKSSPEAIKQMFGVSKKVFKKAIGALYKDQLIIIEKNGIRLMH